MANGISSGDNAWRKIAIDAMSDADRAKSANIGSDMNSMIDRALERADEIQRDLDEDLDEANDAAKPTALDYVNATLEGLAGIANAFASVGGTGSLTNNNGDVATSGQSQIQMTLDSAIKNYNENNPATVTALQSAVDAATARQGEISNDLSGLEERYEDFKSTDDKAQYFKEQTTEALTTNAEIVDEQNGIIKANETIENQLANESLELTSQKSEVQKGTETAQDSKDEATEQKGLMQTKITDINGQEVAVKENKEGAIQRWRDAKADVTKYTNEAKNLNTQKGILEGELNTIKSDTTTYVKTETTTDANGNTTTKTVPDEAKRNAAISAKQAEINKVKDKIATAEANKKTAEDKAKAEEENIQVGEKTLAELSGQKSEAEQTRDKAIEGIQQAVNNITALKEKDATLTDNIQNISTNLKNLGTKNANAKSAVELVESANKDINEMQLDSKEVAETAKQTKKELEANIKSLQTEKKALDKSVKKANKLISAPKTDDTKDKDGATPVTTGKTDDTKGKDSATPAETGSRQKGIETPQGNVPGTGMTATDKLLGSIAIDRAAKEGGYTKKSDGTYSKDGVTYKYDSATNGFVEVPKEKEGSSSLPFVNGSDKNPFTVEEATNEE